MHIAQIAPLTEAIPPKLYGGTERVISWLTDELVALGHEVVLFASGDSRTSAHLEACWPKALRLPEHQMVFATFSSIPVISISDAQRRPVSNAGWIRTIHHGLPERLLMPQSVSPTYFAFLGRISEKAVDRAIWIAKRFGVPLKIAAKVDAVDRDYFESEIRKLLAAPDIEYVGEIMTAKSRAFSAAPSRCWRRSPGPSLSA
jgi:glycosyltransferase involved in cell wall biosynthesis